MYVPGADGDLGEVVIREDSAKDPDEDLTLTYFIDGDEVTSFDENGEKLVEPQNFEVTVKDEHGLPDSQEVIVKTETQLRQPTYSFTNALTNEQVLSREDPVCVTMTLPDDITGFEFSDQIGSANQVSPNTIKFGIAKSPNFVSSYPLCDVTNFDITQIDSHLTQFIVHNEFTNPVSGSVSYGDSPSCQQELSSTTTIDVPINPCTVYAGDENYPFPYVDGSEYHRYQRDEDGILIEDELSRDPFLANNVCCVADGDSTRVNTGETCFDQIGCFGDAENKHYQYEKVLTCGTRGNICGSESDAEPVLVEGPFCGNNEKMLSCSGIADKCQNVRAYSLIPNPENEEENIGWCNGELGCKEFCSKEEGDVIVAVGTVLTNRARYYDQFFANPNPSIMNIKFSCGCTDDNDYSLCDADFDGWFQGTCLDQECHPCDDGLCGESFVLSE